MNTSEFKNGGIITFGEIMMRLKSPSGERFFQSPNLEVTFGGAEANVAVLLAELGCKSNFITVVSKNDIGKASLRELSRYGVLTSHCKEKDGRLGIYFLEPGADQRPSRVIYDRANSCASEMQPDDFDWDSIFKTTEATWFHVTGITPALSKSAADATEKAVSAAKKAGLTVSLDINYRKKLWQYGEAPSSIMSAIVSQVDVLIANEEDIQLALGLSVPGLDSVGGVLDESHYRKLMELVVARYPGLSIAAVTLRESFSADRNRWSALLYHKNNVLASKKYVLEDIVDRVGAGDSFAGALIYGLQNFGSDLKKILNFAVSAAVLKHTIKGDFNLVTKEEIENLANGDESGRVKR